MTVIIAYSLYLSEKFSGLRYLLLTLLFTFLADYLQAGLWPQGKGNGYFNVAFTYLKYNEVINGSLFGQDGFDKLPLKRSVSDHTLNGYLEYGISDRLTVIANVPFKLLKAGEKVRSLKNDPFAKDTLTNGTLNTLGNINIGARYLIARNELLWSLQLTSGVRSAAYQHNTGLRSGYNAWYLTPKLEAGKSWGKTYFSTSLGYRYKSNGYAHDLVTDNEFGYQWRRSSGRSTWFILTAGAVLPVTEGRHDDKNTEQTGLYRDEEGFVDPGLKINHYITERWSINISSIGALWARHGGNQLTYTGGISYEW